MTCMLIPIPIPLHLICISHLSTSLVSHLLNRLRGESKIEKAFDVQKTFLFHFKHLRFSIELNFIKGFLVPRASLLQCFKPNHVSQYFPKWISIDSLLHRIKAIANLGLESEEWSHQKNYRSRHSKLGVGNNGNERFDKLYCLSSRSEADFGDQVAIFSHDY